MKLHHQNFVFICSILALSLTAGCGKKADEAPFPAQKTLATAEFVGSTACADCHEKAMDDWHGSHHQLAMQPANVDTVLGDFNDATYDHHGIKSRFFKRGDTFYVNTEGPDGQNADFAVAYAFGVYPLQQYLVQFPQGRMQVLHLCWDSRSTEDGGQRWYHLYPDEKIDYTDILHWTGVNFNWNYMCADCHSTHLKKNYDVPTLTYNTTWTEISVGCEACHGPGSEHVKWAQSKPADSTGFTEEQMGLTASLKDSKPVAWTMNQETGQPVRSHPKESDAQINACARCHSHRRLIQGDFVHGQDLLDTHKPAVLEERLYHHDGQIKEEVYVYGSFVQSKMYQHGVRCNDCHNPHSLQLHAPGNALCLRCHDGSKYHTPEHHHHPMDSTGAACVDCHMPIKHFMVVDARRDHSIRIPRPDLSEKLGTPNACNMCHTDQTVAWTAEAFKKWHPEEVKKPHYGEVLAAANRGEPNALPRLIELTRNPAIPPIVRATAMWHMQNYRSQDALQTLLNGVEDEEPIVREASVAGFASVQPQQRIQLLAPLLEDAARSVRTETVRLLAQVPSAQLSPEQQKAYAAAEEDFFGQQAATSDRAGAHMGMGIYYSDRGDIAKAEAAYRTAFRVEPDHIESRLNLAEMFYQQGRQTDGLQLIGEAVAAQPNNSLTHEAMGRYYIRQKQYKKGMQSIGTAVRLAPTRPDLRYFYGVGLHELDRYKEALPQLQKAHELAPQHIDYLVALVTIARDNRDYAEARRWAEKLVSMQPSNPSYQALLNEVRKSSGTPGTGRGPLLFP